MKVAKLLLVAACSASAPSLKQPPPPPPPDAPAEAGGATAVRREHKPFSLAILGIEVEDQIGADATKLAVDLTDELRKQAREDGLITLGAERRELVDEKVMNGCASMTGKCRNDLTRKLGVDHLLYGGITNGTPHGVHLVLYEATSDIAIEWTGEVTDDAADLARIAKTAFDSLISRSP